MTAERRYELRHDACRWCRWREKRPNSAFCSELCQKKKRDHNRKWCEAKKMKYPVKAENFVNVFLSHIPRPKAKVRW